MPKILLSLTLLLFGGLTAAAVWERGYTGVLTQQMQNFGGQQVFFDLVIALTLIMIWIWQDAKATGRNFWPWCLLTLILGSFGPLFYLLFQKKVNED